MDKEADNQFRYCHNVPDCATARDEIPMRVTTALAFPPDKGDYPRECGLCRQPLYDEPRPA